MTRAHDQLINDLTTEDIPEAPTPEQLQGVSPTDALFECGHCHAVTTAGPEGIILACPSCGVRGLRRGRR